MLLTAILQKMTNNYEIKIRNRKVLQLIYVSHIIHMKI